MGLFKKQKDPVVEMEKDLVHEENGMEHDIQADVDAVMKKYDRESNTRVWEGIPKTMLRALMASFSVYCILMTLFSKALPERRLSLFLGFIVIIGYLVYPAKKGDTRVNHVPWYDWILMVLGAGSFFYFAINAFSIIQLATKLQPIHIVIGTIGILVLIELCRRCVGLPILCVLCALLIYTFYNQLSWDPSFYKALKNIVYKLFYTTSGVIGTPVSVCYTYIVLFIIFGAFLERTGIANFFISFANRLAGWSSGGPAKVAVVASAAFGTISGAAAANVVGTGTFTIPLMKDCGYPPEFAGAVEACASTGGQLVPPVMGAACFIMAEYIGIPYSNIMIAGLIPALLYYLSVFITVDLRSKKLGLLGMPKDQLPSVKAAMKSRGHLAIPFLAVIYMIIRQYTISFAALVGIILVLVVSPLKKETRLSFKQIAMAFVNGGQKTVSFGVSCACVGMIIGVATLTGVGNVLGNYILILAGGKLLPTCFLAMLLSILLGMGLPCTGVYIVMATIVAPALVRLNVPIVAAHLFCFYFGIMASITPPVAIAAYAGAGIAQCNPAKAGWISFRIAIPSLMIPYVFVYNSSILLVTGMGVMETVTTLVSATCGIVLMCIAFERYASRYCDKLAAWKAVCIGVGGFMMIVPGILTDILGIAIAAVMIVPTVLVNRRKELASE